MKKMTPKPRTTLTYEWDTKWGKTGLHPNFPPVISRVRRLFRPSWGVSFVVVVSCSSQFFRPPFTL